MNRFVRYYIDARKVDTKPENRQLLFASTAMTIADFGTINDLKALKKYYQYEWEVISNESITRTVSAV